MFGQDYIDSLMQRFGMSEDELADYIANSGAKTDDEVLSGLMRNRGADNAFIQGNFTGGAAADKAAFNAKVIADRKDRLRRQNEGAVPSYKAESTYPKRAREAIVQGVTDVDPLLQLGLLNSVYGDNEILQMYNTNQQNEQQRLIDAKREEYVKAVEKAEDEKTKSFEEAKTRKEALKTAKDEADRIYSQIYDNSGKGKNYADVSDLDWTNLQIARNAVADAGGDTKKFDNMLANKNASSSDIERPISKEPKTTDEQKTSLKNEKAEVLNLPKPKSVDKAAVEAYNAKIDAFNDKLKGTNWIDEIGLIEQDKKAKYVAPKSFDPLKHMTSNKSNRETLKKNGFTVKIQSGTYKVYDKNGKFIGDMK